MYGQHHHVRLDLHSDFDRLTDDHGHAVGVGDGGRGGGSSGMSARRALRNRRAVDLTGGNQHGAIVAAAVAAAGRRGTGRALSPLFVESNPLSDYTLPFVSLFGGRQVARLLRMAFGDKESGRDPALFLRHGDLTTSSAESIRWAAVAGCAPRCRCRADGIKRLPASPCRWGVIDNFPVREMARLGRGGDDRHRHPNRGALARAPAFSVEETWWPGSSSALIWKRQETLPSRHRAILLPRPCGKRRPHTRGPRRPDLLIVPP